MITRPNLNPQRVQERRSTHTGRAVLVGATAGIVGAGAMNVFQWLWAFPNDENKAERPGRIGQGGPLTKAEESETATERAASRLARAVWERKPSARARRLAGVILHALTGAAAGGVYSAVANVAPAVTAGRGAPFGAAVWLLADQVAVPLLGLSRPPPRHRSGNQVMNLCAHFIFGMTTEAIRRASSAYAPGDDAKREELDHPFGREERALAALRSPRSP